MNWLWLFVAVLVLGWFIADIEKRGFTIIGILLASIFGALVGGIFAHAIGLSTSDLAISMSIALIGGVVFFLLENLLQGT